MIDLSKVRGRRIVVRCANIREREEFLAAAQAAKLKFCGRALSDPDDALNYETLYDITGDRLYSITEGYARMLCREIANCADLPRKGDRHE